MNDGFGDRWFRWCLFIDSHPEDTVPMMTLVPLKEAKKEEGKWMRRLDDELARRCSLVPDDCDDDDDGRGHDYVD